MFSTCEVRCCICGQPMDWMKRYGREDCSCGPSCHREFEWRRTLAIMGKAYYPDPEPITAILAENPCRPR